MLRLFKIVALLEGLSLLLLLLFAMPMKYMFGQPAFVQVIGMAHGVLFLLYIMFAVILKTEQNWDVKNFIIICLASVVPFGTFWVEKKYLSKTA
jgi:integral membrane protein